MSSYWLGPRPTSTGSANVNLIASSGMKDEATVNLVSTPLS
jgi:hypothetical protein